MHRLIQRILMSLILIVISSAFLNAQSGPYSRVKVYTGSEGLAKMALAGLAVDHGDHRPGVWFTGDFSSEEVELLKTLGLSYEIQITDLTQHFVSGLPLDESKIAAAACGISTPLYPVPSGFSLGSMGGFFTYSEMIAHLDNMAALYPHIITVKQPIGPQTTSEGRPVYFVKISDNPNIDEAEPRVLYSAVHHAREPVSMSQLIFYMYYLLEQYGNDPMITQLVNETEMYFVPCVNPDGYIYNETTNPSGGGFWRKNRRDNLNGSWGVDLNRNYGFNWAYNNLGSSPQTNSDTYRGPSAFSEPETQLMKLLCDAKQFKIAFNYHAFSDLLIYPWGYDYSTYTPDSARYVNYGQLLTRYNKYTYGTADQTVGYIVNGSSDDWMYGEQISKPMILAMTPEVGSPSDGFWPASSRIIPLCKDNVWPNLNLALLAGKYAAVTDLSPPSITGPSGFIRFSLQQLGLDTNGTYTVSLQSLQPALSGTGSPKIIGPLNSLQTKIDSISYTINPGAVFGTVLSFLIEVNSGTITFRDTIRKVVGSPSVVFANNGSSMNGFSGGWGLSNSIYYSAPSSFTDSPLGNYQPNSFRMLEYNTAINLTGATSAFLKFKTRFEIEPNWDYAQVLVNPNGGISWFPLCGKYTKSGSQFQTPGEPVYDGFQTSWVDEIMNLEDYLGMNIRLRFEFRSDGFQEYDGIYIDDLVVEVISSGITGMDIHPKAEIVLGQNIPNPSVNTTFINYSGTSENDVLTIVDVMGRTVFTKVLNSSAGNLQLNTSNWKSGVYFYSIIGADKRSKSIKMIVY